jgi:hypothetical protein
MRWVEFHKLFVTPKSRYRKTALQYAKKIITGDVVSLVAHDTGRSNVNSLVKAADLRKLSATTLLPARLGKKVLFL